MTRLSPGDTEPEASGETAEERMCLREGKAQGEDDEWTDKCMLARFS